MIRLLLRFADGNEFPCEWADKQPWRDLILGLHRVFPDIQDIEIVSFEP